MCWCPQDWEGADVSIFENEHDWWVVRGPLQKVDSEQGLLAYMNVFVRCNELVTEYQVSKVGWPWHRCHAESQGLSWTYC